MFLRLNWLVFGLSLVVVAAASGHDRAADTKLEQQVLPLLKARCTKCHGPGKREAKLNLSTLRGLARGGKDGVVVVPGEPDESLLCEKVEADEMPPKQPLSDSEKALLRRWIEQGAAGLPKVDESEPEGADHWAFAPAVRPPTPAVRDASRVRNSVDRFIQSALEARNLSLAPEADRLTLLRRVTFDLTGLPPTPEQIAEFLNDPSPDAYERMVDRCLASPRYGERWGKYWLDAAGYADSNGYFSADSNRPLAYRYRDYVIRSWNDDKPLDRFIQEQLAGDELARFRPGGRVTPEVIELLVATHFLRNGQDGTGESDGNPDEVRADRYAVLEGTTQIIGSALLGLTLQCARCHDHKFEPVTQQDYYQLYAILAPAFDPEHWVKPNDRVVEAALTEELAAWEAKSIQLDAQIAALRDDFATWVKQNRPVGAAVFRDDFNASAGSLAAQWSATAPGDDAPGGTPSVNVDSATAPGAHVKDGALQIIEVGGPGNRWLSTKQAFDWTPEVEGSWIQATFDLVDTKVAPGMNSAERVGYYIALLDYHDNGLVPQGNILFDGNPAGGAAVHLDYPGSDTQQRGVIGSSGYSAGHNYGVRVTNISKGSYRIEHLVDWVPEEKTITLAAADLPDGGFGFEYCCGRSFVVDNVLIERSCSEADSTTRDQKFATEAKDKRKSLDQSVKAKNAQRGERPGRIAWVTDVSAAPPETHLLKRGSYSDSGPVVEPAAPAVLCDPANQLDVQIPFDGATTTGRRLAFARWLTKPGARPSALLARVLANRVWQGHFGMGLVATPENLGYTGASPSHPELLEYLASELVRGGWRVKPLHRLILTSSAYRQASAERAEAARADPENRLLAHFPLRRLDAEAIRDAMLEASGELDARIGGLFIPTKRTQSGEVVVPDTTGGFARRSVYIEQRRTQVLTMLDVFDVPSIVTNCTRRTSSTIALQSLNLLNSDFVLARARGLAKRLQRDAGAETEARLDRAFLLTLGRPPDPAERTSAHGFLESQPEKYPGRADATEQAWVDFCQMLFASNPLLYVE